MTVKQEIHETRQRIKELQDQHDVLRFDIMWQKLYLLAARSGDAELVEDIRWFLPKFKFYIERHARSMNAQDKARRARTIIKDEDYDRLRPQFKSDARLADKLGVNPVSLARYKKRRFS